MERWGAFKAKTHFSELLRDVKNGKKFIITKNGIQIAMVIPFTKDVAGVDPVEDAIRGLKKRRKGVTLGKKLSIRKMREEGRK